MDYKLIYRPLNGLSFEENTFKKYNEKVIKDEDVYIICPYLSIDYLEELTSICKSWRLISDIEAWLLSTPVTSRNTTKDYIINNLTKIRHVNKLHSKLLCSPTSAVVGSANFTNSGIHRNIEFSIFIKNENKVKEINSWADQLWNCSNDIVINELEDFLDSIKTISPIKSNTLSLKHLSQKSPNNSANKLKRYKTSLPKVELIKMFERYVLNEMGSRREWVIEQRLAHIHGHRAGLKIWLKGENKRDFEIRNYFSDKEHDNRDGRFFYEHMMNHPENLQYEKITCIKEAINRNKPNLRFKKNSII